MIRRKITLQLPLPLLATLDELSKRQLGIGRNSFFSLAALLLLIKMTPILPGKKRSSLLKEIEDTFNLEIERARKDA